MPVDVQMLDVEWMAEALLSAFEEAVEAHRVVVVTVESRTGWGKSEAVGRFFSYLREERDATGYWPADLEGGRHDLYPYQWSPEPGAVMPYLWWGCAGNSKTSAVEWRRGRLCWMASGSCRFLRRRWRRSWIVTTSGGGPGCGRRCRCQGWCCPCSVIFRAGRASFDG